MNGEEILKNPTFKRELKLNMSISYRLTKKINQRYAYNYNRRSKACEEVHKISLLLKDH